MEENNFPKLDEVVKQHVLTALELAKGNKAKAAILLGVSVKTVYNHFHRYEMESQLADTGTQQVVSEPVQQEQPVETGPSSDVLPAGTNNIFG